MLVVAGVFVAFGFSLVKDQLRNAGENYYCQLGFIAIIIAIPLFILNMLFWGFSLTEAFKILVSTKAEKLPEWFKPLRELFAMISVIEVALTYFATTVFAVSMHRVGWLTKTSSRVYVLFSVLAFVIILLSAILPEPFVTAGFAVSIPAIPFVMPYFMGVNLLKRAGDSQ